MDSRFIFDYGLPNISQKKRTLIDIFVLEAKPRFQNHP